MRFMIYPLLILFLVAPDLTLGCDCRARTTCAYLPHADVVFVGKVVFTDHNESWGWEQETFERFEVEEVLKGLPPDTDDVWISPGNSSCYRSHPLGERFLVFAHAMPVLPDYFSQGLLIRGQLRKKPLPPGFDLANPPMLYSAASCSGTHQVISKDTDLPPEFEYLRREPEFLRDLFWGRASPTVQGLVFGTTPKIDGPVTVTISGMGIVRSVETDSRGFFVFENLPSGTYLVAPSLKGHRAIPPNQAVSASGSTCGYVEFRMGLNPDAR